MSRQTSSRPQPMTLIAGPCVIEDQGLLFEVAQELKHQLKDEIEKGEIDLFFKSSFDKANRSSIEGFRGPGMKEGLKMLDAVREKTNLRLLTDFHNSDQAMAVAEVVDFLQIPAFLCRQTDMIAAGVEAALKHGRKLNVKKGQFLAPWDAKNIVEKAREMELRVLENQNTKPAGEDWLYLTERGVSFGYNRLVVDMTSFMIMKSFGVPVIYDATHSVQMPGAGAGGKSTGGNREFIEPLARAAIAAGADHLFMETHPRPDQAKSDGPNAYPLEKVGSFVRSLMASRIAFQE